MSLKDKVDLLCDSIAAEIKADRAERGSLVSLNTTTQVSIVAAINELVVLVASGATINDATTALTSTWSSTKINSEITNAISNLVDGAPGLLDTLSELATAFQGNESAIQGILTAQANRLRIDTASQGLTETQKTNGRANLDVYSTAEVGDIANADFVARFQAALA